ncbi:hypothetical protein LINPERHAP1_LOCUS21526, partial [Linum perenne]
MINCALVEPFLRQCKEQVRRRFESRRRNTTAIEKEVHLTFVDWFKALINHDDRVTHNKDLLMLARGPNE